MAIAAALASATLPTLRVDHSRGSPRRLVDEFGRERLLRGVNLGVEWWRDGDRPFDPAAYDGKCPPNSRNYSQPPVCGVDAGRGKYNQSANWSSHNDFAQIRAVGFNVVRLAVSWSLVEPQPFQYDDVYLRRIEQVVGWAAEQDVGVIIDFHQDFYSYHVPGRGADGAPLWACPPPAAYNTTLPPWKAEFYDKIGLGAAPIVAFSYFWNDTTINATGRGVQEHYIRMLAAVARRVANLSAVIGIEIMNEPIPDAELDVLRFSKEKLYPFYARAIQAITGTRDGLPTCDAARPMADGCAFPPLASFDRLVLFEPMGLRNQLDFSPQLGIGAFSSYPDLVYAPHTYTHSFTKKIPIPFTNLTYQPPYALSLDTAWAEADGMNASVLVTEFGAPRADERLEGIVREQDRHFTGSTFWPWKERGGWGMFTHTDNATDQNGPIDPGHVDLLARVMPLAVSGRLLGFEYNYSNHTFAMAASGDGRARAPTEVFIPAHVGAVAVRVAGNATLLNVTRAADGARTAYVEPGDGAAATDAGT